MLTLNTAVDAMARALFDLHAPYSGFAGYAPYDTPKWENTGAFERRRFYDQARAALAALAKASGMDADMLELIADFNSDEGEGATAALLRALAEAMEAPDAR
jgi:hypothetical protein